MCHFFITSEMVSPYYKTRLKMSSCEQSFQAIAVQMRRHQKKNPRFTLARYAAGTEAAQRAKTPLAAGYFATLWGILGDLDYLTKALLLPRSTLASGPCSLCRCTGSGPYTWCDFRPTAPWRTVCWTAHGWRQWPQRSRSPLFSFPGFTPFLIALDWMHCKYLGHDQLCYASILMLLIKYILRGTAEENVAQIWRDLKGFYQEHKIPCRYRTLKLSMIQRKDPQYPKLRGKAAEVKWLAAPLLYIWEKYFNKNLQSHRQVHAYLQLNLELERTLQEYREHMAFPQEVADRFEHTCSAMLLVASGLAEFFLEEKLFNLTQKAHFMQHISMLARYVSPRLTWCFSGEDMQRRISHLCKACVNGQQPSQSVLKLIARYRLGLHLQFLDHVD